MRIALIGAGPRGLLMLERLLAWWPHTFFDALAIDLFDPYPLGGRIWRRDQDPTLLMNTVAGQLTLFYDQTIQSLGPYRQGPSLAAWAQTEAPAFLSAQAAPAILQTEAAALAPNDYASRALYGYYQAWVFARLCASTSATVTHHRRLVSSVRRTPAGFAVDDAAYDAVVLALGNSENALTREQAAFATFAEAHQRLYLPPGFPAEGDLSALGPKDVVLMRGLGLSAHDFIHRLTVGFGGTFDADGYHPSGREPRILAMSRRGYPYHTKAVNQKAPGEQVAPLFITQAQLARWQQQGGVSGKEFEALLRREVEFTYYSRLLATSPSLASFQLAFTQDPQAAINTLPASQRLDWETLLQPTGSARAFLQADVADAALGSKTAPLGSALEVLRDLRDAVRQLRERELLADDDFLDWFLRGFNSNLSFLSIGPPLQRNQELLALLDAGIVTILPTGLRVQAAHGHFLASDATRTYRATALIDARLPTVSATTATNPLIQQLLHDGLATPYELQLLGNQRFQAGALLVDRRTHRLLNRDHADSGLLFCWGVPTEGVHWLTNTSPRPLVNDVNLRWANEIAMQILGV